MSSPDISDNVGIHQGKPCSNRPADVRLVKQRLNAHGPRFNLPKPLDVENPACGSRTIQAIKDFQQLVMKMTGPRGRIRPISKGATLKELLKPPPVAKKAAAAPSSAKPGEIVIDGKKISAKAQRILTEILQTAGLSSATISSVARDPYNQARVMYDNLVGTGKGQGVAAQKKLYAAAGDKVVDVYVANKSKSRADVIKLMQKKIEEVGPSKVSNHAGTSGFETFDVAPSSIKDKAKFEKALKEHKEVSNYILPPKDPGYHFEIEK